MGWAKRESLFEQVADHLEVDDLDKAIATWSSHVEEHLLAHGQPTLPEKRYRSLSASCPQGYASRSGEIERWPLW